MDAVAEGTLVEVEPMDVETVQARAAIYSFIARFFGTVVPVPGTGYVVSLMEAFAGFMEQDEKGAGCSDARHALKAAKRRVDADPEREQMLLATDRTKFVLGLKENNSVKPPFESLYLTANDSLEEIADIAGFYREAGYELMSQNSNRPDSFATECLFMAQLCQEQASSLRSEGSGLARSIGELQGVFFTQHLGKWALDFCNEAAACSQSQVFKAMMLFVCEFVEGEKEVLA